MSVKITDVVRKFRGDTGEDIDIWLDRFQVAIDLTSSAADQTAKDKEMAKLMPLFLEAAAYATWKQIPPGDRENLTVIKSDLRRVFGKSKMSAWTELKSIKVLPGESVDVVAEQIKGLLQCATAETKVAESLVALHLMDALPEQVAEKVAMQHGEELKLTKVINATKALVSSRDSATCAAAYAERRRGRGVAGGRPPAESSRCSGCRRSGHEAKDCRVICYRCRARGHIQRFCPSGNGLEEAGSAGSPTSPDQH